MIAVFNVDSRLSVGLQLNLAHVARNFKKAVPLSFRLKSMKAVRKE